MGKKPAAKLEQSTDTGADLIDQTVVENSSVSTSTPPDLSKPVIQQAIAQGKVLISQGQSKADAARAIFSEIKDEPKEVIVAAFVEGATLTEKGALTYWYNCKRRAAKGE